MKLEVCVSLILSFNNSSAFRFPQKIIFHILLSSFLLAHTKHYAAVWLRAVLQCSASQCTYIDWPLRCPLSERGTD